MWDKHEFYKRISVLFCFLYSHAFPTACHTCYFSSLHVRMKTKLLQTYCEILDYPVDINKAKMAIRKQRVMNK